MHKDSVKLVNKKDYYINVLMYILYLSWAVEPVLRQQVAEDPLQQDFHYNRTPKGSHLFVSMVKNMVCRIQLVRGYKAWICIVTLILCLNIWITFKQQNFQPTCIVDWYKTKGSYNPKFCNSSRIRTILEDYRVYF